MSFPALLQDSVFDNATVVASSTAAGNFNAANISDLRNYTFWKPATLPATLTIDCGAAVPADYFALFAHNLFSCGCTAQLVGSTDNFSTSNVTVATLAPTGDLPAAIKFNSVSYRYWKISITGTTPPTIGIALAGAGLYMPTGVESGYDPIGTQITGSQNTNDNGNPLGIIIDSEGAARTLQFKFVTWTWLRNTFLPAWRNGLRGSPALLAWDLANYPNEIRLVKLGMKWNTPHQAGQWADLSFDISGPAS